MRRASIAAVVFAAALGTAALGVALFATRGSSVTRSLVYAKQSTRGSTIWRANVDGSHPVRLAAGRDPPISPGGRLVAFVGREKPPTAINWSLPSSSILTIQASGGRN